MEDKDRQRSPSHKGERQHLDLPNDGTAEVFLPCAIHALPDLHARSALSNGCRSSVVELDELPHALWGLGKVLDRKLVDHRPHIVVTVDGGSIGEVLG